MLKNFTCVLTLILFMVGLLFTMKMCAEPIYELEKTYAIKEIDLENFQMNCWNHYRYQKKLALDILRNLEEHSILYPPSSDREKATAFFQAAISSLSSADPRAKLTVIFLSLVTSYGMVIIDQYHQMAHQYYDAQYHMNLADFYLDCALKGNK
jgi:hypothetical protein